MNRLRRGGIEPMRCSVNEIFGRDLWRRCLDEICGRDLWTRFVDEICGRDTWINEFFVKYFRKNIIKKCNEKNPKKNLMSE